MIPVVLPSPCATASMSLRQSIRAQVLVMQKRTDYKKLPFGIDVKYPYPLQTQLINYTKQELQSRQILFFCAVIYFFSENG